jgi:O-antigen/teichoic acid export membrane protein
MKIISIRDFANLSFMNIALAFSSGLCGVIVANKLGPESRGELAKMVGLFMPFCLIADQGYLNAATYFAGKYSSNIIEIKKVIHRKLLVNCIQASSAILLLHLFFDEFFPLVFMCIFIFLICINYFFAGPLHILQSHNIYLWKKTLTIQIPFYILLSLFFFFINCNLYTSFIGMMSIPLVSSLFANKMLSKVFTEASNQIIDNLKLEISNYSKQNILLLAFAEIYKRIDFWIIIFLFGSFNAGVYIVAISWMLLFAPISEAIGNIVFPLLSKNVNTLPAYQFSSFVRNIFLKAIIIDSAITGFSLIAGIYLIPYLYNDQYSESIDLLYFVIPITISKLLTNLCLDLAKSLNIQGKFSMILIFLLLFGASLFYFSPTKTLNDTFFILNLFFILTTIISINIIFYYKKLVFPLRFN